MKDDRVIVGRPNRIRAWLTGRMAKLDTEAYVFEGSSCEEVPIPCLRRVRQKKSANIKRTHLDESVKWLTRSDIMITNKTNRTQLHTFQVTLNYQMPSELI